MDGYRMGGFRGGFTLLEVLVTVALFAVLAGLAVLDLRPVRARWQLDAAAQQLELELKQARTRAIAQGVVQRVRFSPGSNRYQVESAAGDGFAPRAAIDLPGDVTVVECNAATESITFHPRGHARTFGTITLANALGESRRVIVNIVGRIRML